MKKFVCVVMACMLVGCSDERHPDKKNYSEFSLDDVLIKIGEKTYTKRECENDAALTFALKTNRTRNRKKAEVSDRERMWACGNFISGCAVEKGLQKRGVNVSRKVDERRLRRRVAKMKHDVENAEERLRRKMTRDAMVSAYISDVVRKDYPVSSNEIFSVHRRIKTNNEMAVATNVLVYALASNVYSRITRGEDFDKLADKYDEAPNHGGPGEWGTFSGVELEAEEELLRLLRKSATGMVLPPIEADEGLLIVKVMKKSGMGFDCEINKDPEQYELKRIYFRLPVFYKEETFSETRNNIYRAKCKGMAKDIIDSAIKDINVEYPNGIIMWNMSKGVQK